MHVTTFFINRLAFTSCFLFLLIALSACSDNSTAKHDQSEPIAVTKAANVFKDEKKLVYIVSDTTIPFWKIMARGASSATKALGYQLDIRSSNNNMDREFRLAQQAVDANVSGIIISPTSSSSCFNVLKLANKANIPVVISDIGTNGGDFVTYISSNNTDGAYAIGKVLTEKMHTLGATDADVGIVAIPQDRLNAQARTAGFMRAMHEAGIYNVKIKEQVSFSEEETYRLCKELIATLPNLRALWLQGSDKYKGALRAISETGKKNDVLLVTFDAEPEFSDLISNGIILGSAMQQPYLMGKGAVYTMDRHLRGKKVDKIHQLPVLIASQDNIDKKRDIIQKNVLGIEQ